MEGFYSKALEHFQIALSYYEYCFPEDPKAELHLKRLRHASYNNAALCCLKLLLYRECVQYTSTVITEIYKYEPVQSEEVGMGMGAEPPTADDHIQTQAQADPGSSTLDECLEESSRRRRYDPAVGALLTKAHYRRGLAWIGE